MDATHFPNLWGIYTYHADGSSPCMCPVEWNGYDDAGMRASNRTILKKETLEREENGRVCTGTCWNLKNGVGRISRLLYLGAWFESKCKGRVVV